VHQNQEKTGRLRGFKRHRAQGKRLRAQGAGRREKGSGHRAPTFATTYATTYAEATVVEESYGWRSRAHESSEALAKEESSGIRELGSEHAGADL
jgi:hypothetical protein